VLFSAIISVFARIFWVGIPRFFFGQSVAFWDPFHPRCSWHVWVLFSMAHGVLFLFHGFLRCVPLFFLLLLKTDACLSSFRLLQVRSLIRLYQTWQQVLQGLLIFSFSCFPRVCLFFWVILLSHLLLTSIMLRVLLQLNM